MQAPCKDCPDRKIGCHSTCEKYIAFDKYRKEFLEQRRKEKLAADDYFYASARKYRRSRRKW